MHFLTSDSYVLIYILLKQKTIFERPIGRIWCWCWGCCWIGWIIRFTGNALQTKYILQIVFQTMCTFEIQIKWNLIFCNQFFVIRVIVWFYTWIVIWSATPAQSTNIIFIEWNFLKIKNFVFEFVNVSFVVDKLTSIYVAWHQKMCKHQQNRKKKGVLTKIQNLIKPQKYGIWLWKLYLKLWNCDNMLLSLCWCNERPVIGRESQ